MVKLFGYKEKFSTLTASNLKPSITESHKLKTSMFGMQMCDVYVQNSVQII